MPLNKIHVTISDLAVSLPEGFEIIETKRREELERKADMDGWWTTADVVERYKRAPTWFTDHVLKVPRFEKILRNNVVIYADTGGSYLFEPTSFARFMRDYFPEISSNLEKQKVR
ncbi:MULTISPECIES: DUF771 domain-containing protein [Lapidilactobacillus]|uniref:DUF771 domain-containing protein n=1 Tax=Lapidilactobacillus gannanensis TaxID=2486002 RepID=A0ABW4BL90_9LACO|nr:MULTISPECIES: DUF771 domain-containing protein [Lapidilactobacillus]